MVCVPCFIIPVLLYLFHRFVQPIIYGLWGEYLQEPIFTCPLPAKKKKPIADTKSTANEQDSSSSKNIDTARTSDAEVKAD